MKPTTPTILIVDDDPNDLMLVRAAFSAAAPNAKIQIINGGGEALAYMRGEGKYADRSQYKYPDFVITDLKMPGIDGFAILEHLKHHAETAMIPTVILSGSQDNDDIKKAYLLGASSYHLKPSDHTELRGLVKDLHNYWLRCEIPDGDDIGGVFGTQSDHKLGQRFSERM